MIQEFKEGRRANQQAPQVLFSHKDPPQELRDAVGAGHSLYTGDNVGYVTFGAALGSLASCLVVPGYQRAV